MMCSLPLCPELDVPFVLCRVKRLYCIDVVCEGNTRVPQCVLHAHLQHKEGPWGERNPWLPGKSDALTPGYKMSLNTLPLLYSPCQVCYKESPTTAPLHGYRSLDTPRH